jgi:hypothetical protein
MLMRSEDMPPDHFFEVLWLAAGEGKIKASGLECADEKDFDGRLTEIPPYVWPKLRRRTEPSGKAMLVGPDRVYRGVEFSRLDVKTLWPIKAASSEAEIQAVPTEPPGPKRKTNNRRGRPKEYNWDDIKSFALDLVAKFGVPGEDNKKLPRREDLVIAIQDEWAARDIHLAPSTVRKYVSGWLSEL